MTVCHIATLEPSSTERQDLAAHTKDLSHYLTLISSESPAPSKAMAANGYYFIGFTSLSLSLPSLLSSLPPPFSVFSFVPVLQCVSNGTHALWKSEQDARCHLLLLSAYGLEIGSVTEPFQLSRLAGQQTRDLCISVPLLML